MPPELNSYLVFAGPGRWAVDPAASYLQFEARLHGSFATVRGEFERFAGTLAVTHGFASAELTIEAASVRTGNEEVDLLLRSSDFLDVEHNPTVEIVVSSVEPGVDGWMLGGSLVLRGARFHLRVPAFMSEEAADCMIVRTHTVTTPEPSLPNQSWLSGFGRHVVIETEISLVRQEALDRS
jgi:polyisoprenoid-binding protein YceI